MKQKKLQAMALALSAVLGLSACGTASSTVAEQTAVTPSAETTAEAEETASVTTTLDQIDMTKWQYNSDDNVYYQIGISYCADPADENYETLAVFVPGDYFTAMDNGDGTYTCELSANEVNGYTAETAPIVFPVNTPGYAAQNALTDYTDVSDYTDAGFVYVHAGLRGRDAGAPSGVVDAKAAIRYIRYNSGVIAGDTENIFVFGMSGGGAQSAIIGASGDSDLYTPYLEEIGAVMNVSDAVAGSMDWCPITGLDSADESYEWMMGVTRTDLSDEEQSISDALAESYASWVNAQGFTDSEGNVLTLEESEDGIYQAGSYYDYLKSVIEESLNNFLSDTAFPYDASSASSGGMGGPGGGMEGEKPEGAPDGNFPGNGEGPEGKDGETDYSAVDDIARNGSSTSGLDLSGTYETAQDYIDALNANGTWVSYDAETNTATITSIEEFVTNMKTASKSLGAFDQLDGGQDENELFGYGDGNGAHFDSILASILNEPGNEYAADYEADLAKTDSLGTDVQTRLNMYTPLYYLMESSEGYGTSTPAKYWRIRTGICQSDTALTTEVNLALALESNDAVSSVDFATVWGQGHTMAERTGDSTSNFIAWVMECTQR